ncbi:SMI1/KNR4 family protein [Gulosibacter sp. 10]|uniref:SMI1/KNR4 family protein n=1 Tax=Gulosibacter sp. 10 TaxID=1255570 RepID=UPI00097ED109|nr:SMI1/KNR4 family protein [Gulosibacter sp. 10]SJM58890.1 hypothetical protein FM112_06230 [Gulosibacter sp. 10]
MEIARAWDVIDRVLHDRVPAVARTLRGPASEAGIDRLAEAVGRELPEEFAASLRIHDGQDNPTSLLDLFDHQTLMSAEAMIEHSAMRVDALGDDLEDVADWMEPEKVRPIMNCRGWLQFTQAEASGFALDLEPLPAGDYGQVIHLPVDGLTPAPEYASYAAWLSDLAERFEAGAFRVEDGDGIWLER